MKINGKEVPVEELLKETDLRSNFHNDYGNGIFLTEQQLLILERYGFNPKNYSDVKSLIFDIEDYLNQSTDIDSEDLDYVATSLSEFDYYHNTNK